MKEESNPSLKDGRPVADVTLAKGEETKTTSVPLQKGPLIKEGRTTQAHDRSDCG